MQVYNNYINFQNNPNQKEKYYALIEEELQPIFRRAVNKASRELREDLYQELRIHLYIILLQNKFVLNIDSDKEFFIQKYIVESPKNEALWNKAQNDSNARKTFEFEMINFVGSIKFKKYLSISFSHYATDFMIKNSTKNISLNETNDYGYEEIELVADNSKPIETIDWNDYVGKISNTDLCFIKKFVDKMGNILTQKQVAKKCAFRNKPYQKE